MPMERFSVAADTIDIQRKLPASFARPALPVLIALMAGIGLGVYVPDQTRIFQIAAYITGLAVLQALFRGRGALAAPLLFIAVLGGLSISPYATLHPPPGNVIHHADNRTQWKITGIVQDQPWPASNHRLKFDVGVIRLEASSPSSGSQALSEAENKQRGIVRATLYGGGAVIDRGDRITFVAKLKPFKNFKNPGGFDYRRFLAFKGIRAAADLDAGDILAQEKRTTGVFLPHMDRFRKRAVEWIARQIEGDARAVMQALIVGESAGLTPELWERFNRSGASHLLSISGLHIGIIAFLAFRLCVWGLSFFTPLLWNAWPRKIAALAAIIAAVVYGLLAGMAPATQRSLIMTGLFLGAFMFRRESEGLNAVFTAALAILIVHPPALFSISCQLSFGAVAAIIYGFPKVRSTERKPENRLHALGRRMTDSVLVSMLAILGTMPLVMFHFNQISLIGIVLNIVLIPLMGTIAVPAGLLAVFLFPVSEGAASLCLAVGAASVRAGLAIIDGSLEIPFAYLATFAPTVFEIALYYGALGAILNLRERARTKPANEKLEAKPAWNRRALAALMLFAAAACGNGLYWMHERFGRDDLRVTILDVGFGSSVLLELPGGETMLIDGGGFSNNAWFDIGESVIAPFLRRKKIMTVDRLVLTHPDSDHLNGLLYIAGHFHVREVWTTGEAADNDGYREWLGLLKEKNIRHPEWDRLADSSQVIRGVTFTFLYPPSGYAESGEKGKQRKTNETSMVLKVAFGDTAFLFPGDIIRRGEQELVESAGAKLKSTVLLAPHHGSNTSSSEPLIAAVDPEIVIFSVDADNRFKFPHPPVVERYVKAGVKRLGTHLNGAVTMVSDGKTMRVETVYGE